MGRDTTAKYVSEDTNGGGVLAIDFGLSRDWAAAAIVKRVSGAEMRLLRRDVWKPGNIVDGDRIQISKIESYIERAIERFRLSKVVIERWEMVATIQKMTLKYPGLIEEFVPTEQSVIAISHCLWEIISQGVLRWPPDKELEEELKQLEVKEGRNSNWSIVYRRRAGGHGHGDVSRAVAMALYRASGGFTFSIDDLVKMAAGDGTRAGGGALDFESGRRGEWDDEKQHDEFDILPAGFGGNERGGDW
jgi:phage terminase large subunit-like protein